MNIKEFIKELRKSAEAIYLAVEESTADDISQKLCKAASLLESRWISVEDQLPEENTIVLLFLVTTNSSDETQQLTDKMVGYWNGIDWEDDSGDWVEGNTWKVTHWCELPERPGKGKQTIHLSCRGYTVETEDQRLVKFGISYAGMATIPLADDMKINLPTRIIIDIEPVEGYRKSI